MSNKKNKKRKSSTPMIDKFVRGQKSTTPNTTKDNIKILAWGACPYVITGFGVIMRELLTNLYKSHPGVYDVDLLAINYQGNPFNEEEITGGLGNGRLRQWPAAVAMPDGRSNLYGQPKFLELLKESDKDYDVIFLFEDPFWIGGVIPGSQPQTFFIDAIKQILELKGMSHVPIVSYFPIDGVPKSYWINNIAKSDIPITYLQFGARECIKACPNLNGRIGVIHHGTNPDQFYPIPEEEARTFKRAMFGDKFVNHYMIASVNRNQMRKLIPSTLIAFKKFKEMVPDSFLYLNMKAVDVGWNLIEVCRDLGLEIGRDVMLPPDFHVQKGLSIEDLNKVFNCADLITSTAVGGGWELSITQAFSTKTPVLMPANTSHIELCGNQQDEEERRGVLYASGRNLSQLVVLPTDNEVVRPLPDLDHMVTQMKWIYDHPNEVSKMTDIAYKWVTNTILWKEHIAPQFHNVFSQAKNLKNQKLNKAMQKKIQIDNLKNNTINPLLSAQEDLSKSINKVNQSVVEGSLVIEE